MDNKDNLRALIANLINDKSEEATLDFHNYIVPAMKQAAGITVAAPVEETPPVDDTAAVETPPSDTE
jgi:hypothetical protein